MQQEAITEKESIVNLFEKMHSNITKYRASINAPPNHSRTQPINPSLLQPFNPCSCRSIKKQRQLEVQLYSSQHQLVSKVSTLLEAQGNDTLSKLLAFMSEYLNRLAEEVKKQLICECQKKKIQLFEEYTHKIAFLRDENHKFFKMIEQKNEECDLLKKEVEMMNQQFIEMSKQTQIMPMPITIQSKVSNSPGSREQISSRTISSNSSRVSEFRVAWPELIMPINQGVHKAYFQPSPGDRQPYVKEEKRFLKERNTNESFDFGPKKSKIFCGSCLIN